MARISTIPEGNEQAGSLRGGVDSQGGIRAKLNPRLLDKVQERKTRSKLEKARLSRAARKIQAAWRGWRTRTALAARWAAALTIQAAYRGWRVRRHPGLKRAFLKIRNRKLHAVLTIQTMWRGAMARDRYRDRLLDAIADRRATRHALTVVPRMVLQPRAANHLTSVVATSQSSLRALMGRSPDGVLNLAQATVSVAPAPTRAAEGLPEAPSARGHRVVVRPQSAPLRALNTRCLSARTRERLNRVREKTQDLPRLEQALDGHVDRLRYDAEAHAAGEPGGAPPVLYYGAEDGGFAGDLHDTGVRAPWQGPKQFRRWVSTTAKTRIKKKPVKKKAAPKPEPEPEAENRPPAPKLPAKRLGGGFCLPESSLKGSAAGTNVSFRRFR